MSKRAMRVGDAAAPGAVSDAFDAALEGDVRVLGGLARIAGFSGLVFAALLVAAMVLLAQAPNLAAPDSVYTDFYSSGGGSLLITVGLYIVPFAGLAFLWYMSATRTLLQAQRRRRTPDIPHWLQLASGVVFVCMLFAGTAAVGAVALLTVFSTGPLPSPEIARTLSSAGYGMVFVYGVRAAGMFMITTTAGARASGVLPRWVGVLSYLAATFLLLSTTFHPAILLVFPAWVVLTCVTLLIHMRRFGTGSAQPGSPTSSDRHDAQRPASGREST